MSCPNGSPSLLRASGQYFCMCVSVFVYLCSCICIIKLLCLACRAQAILRTSSCQVRPSLICLAQLLSDFCQLATSPPSKVFSCLAARPPRSGFKHQLATRHSLEHSTPCAFARRWCMAHHHEHDVHQGDLAPRWSCWSNDRDRHDDEGSKCQGGSTPRQGHGRPDPVRQHHIV